MGRAMRASLVLGMVLLMAAVAEADTHVGDWDVTGEITASGNFATFGDSSYVTPFAGWSGTSRMVAVRQPTSVSSGVSSGFMFSNNQTSGSQNIAQLMFLNEAIGASEKRVAQILVQTGGATNAGKMYLRVFDGGTGRNALTINRYGNITTYDDLTVTGEVAATVVEVTSDRNAKKDIEPLDSREVLDKVAELPMSTWSFKKEDGTVRHMGPMSQDFHAAFGLGKSDTHITTVDADGVALAAIQGLNQKLEEKEAQIQDYEGTIECLREEMTGREVSEQVRALNPGIRTIYMSAFSSEMLVEQGRLERGVGVLVKPFEEEELVGLVEAAMAARG